ncbi:uncharacterized protein LOC144438793 [Glandiceps talaboti]
MATYTKGISGIVLFLSLIWLSEVECHTNCPKDWTEYSYYCYYFNSNTYSWEDSIEWCRAEVNGGDLVSIHSSGENSFVLGIINTHIHIGFNDLTSEGTWAWSDDRSVVYTSWGSSEPSGNGGLGNCGGLNTNGQWDDYSCTETARPFVCKVAKEWTAVQTGCLCSFDSTRYDCACCRDGGCNCGISYPNECVVCGDTSACGQDYNKPNEEWRVVFKAVSGLNSFDVEDVWTGSSTENDGDTYAPYISYTSSNYKSSEVNSWNTNSFSQIKFAYFDSNEEVMSLVFDSSGTSKSSWYSLTYLKYAPYSDIYSASMNYFSITGDNGLYRHFFISGSYGGCSGDTGWVVICDPTSTVCSWEQQTSRPSFLYSTASTYSSWQSGSALADVMAILFKEEDDTSADLCEAGWTYYGNGCYKTVEETKTWYDAYAACRALTNESDLVSIHSSGEANHVLAMSRWTYVDDTYWIGLHDIDSENDWSWTDGSTFDYSNWYSGEPDNSGDTQDCTVLLWNTDATWSDVDCSGNYKFICKYPLDVASCGEWLRKGYTTDGYYTVDPDGPYNGVDPFRVYCDMNSANDAITEIHHYQETRGKVNGYETILSYAVDVKYKFGVTTNQIAALIDISNSCSQYLKYECYGSILKHGGSSQGAWYDRDGNMMANWAGASTGQAKCACGAAGNCANSVATCNCDNNDNVWREDSGTISDKDYLPVTKVAFGDTGDVSESGYHTVGALYCEGEASNIITSRTDFHVIPESYIYSQDVETLYGKTTAECASECESRTSFTCRSFDYDSVNSNCILSNYNNIMSGGVSSHGNYDLYIRKFDAGGDPFTDTGNCDSGWAEYDSHCYYPNTNTMTWLDAETWCQGYGGHLTATSSASEYSFLRQILRWTASSTDTFLIGYNDIESEGTWVEADGTSHSYSNWYSNEPNGAELENVVLMYARDYDGWVDANVEAQYQFICKADIGASAISQPTVNPACSSGWVSLDDSCYYFSSSTMTFDNAQSDCKSNNGDLAIIDSDAKWNFISQYIRYRYYTRNYWVGFTDTASEGTWVWENGVEDSSNSHWRSGSPDNSGGSEHCARLDQYNGYQDVSCSSSNYFICEDNFYLTDSPNNVAVSAESSIVATVSWGDILQLDGQNSDIIGYTLNYWVRGAQSSTLITETISSPSTYSITLESLEPATTYDFYMTAYNNMGDGPTTENFNITTNALEISGSKYIVRVYRKTAGKYLSGHKIETVQVTSLLHCVNMCTATTNCQSINYKDDSAAYKDCDLNEEVKEAYLNDVNDDAGYIYAGV